MRPTTFCMFIFATAFAIVHGGPDNYRPFQCTTKKFTHKTLTNPKLIWSIQNATEDECAVTCWHLKQAGRDCHSFNYFPTASPKRCDLLEDNLQGKNPNKILTPSKGAAHVIVQRCTKTAQKPTTTIAPISTTAGPIECKVTEYPSWKRLELATMIKREDGTHLDEYATKEGCIDSCIRLKLSGTNCNSISFVNQERCIFLEDSYEGDGANDSYPFLYNSANVQLITVKCPFAAPSKIPPTAGSCGRTFAPSQFPYTGEIVVPRNAAPWEISIRKPAGSGAYCTATLIRVNDQIEESDIAVMPATCMDGIDEKIRSKVYGTAGDRRTAVNISQDKVPIAAVVRHPGYTKSDVYNYNDLAVVKFGRAFKFSVEIQPACLPMRAEQMEIGQRGVAYWWINCYQTSKPIIDSLRQSSAIIISKDECNKAYEAIGLPPVEPKSQFCVKAQYVNNGGGSQYTTNGPYFLPDQQRGHTLEGVNSTPKKVSNYTYKAAPRVYTRVSNYVDWIREQAQKLTAI